MGKFFNPKVSIIIPIYNGEEYMCEAVESAIAQTYENLEIILVNDGSKDNTHTICEAYQKKYPELIKYIKKENGGVATALNTAIKNMEGEYFSWLSHDDLYAEDKIEEQIKALSSLEDKNTIIYNDVEYINKDNNTVSGTSYSEIYTKRQLSSGYFGVINGLLNGCSLLINKSCFTEVGYFDEGLRTTNDYLMWFKLAAKYNFKFIPKRLTKYRFHPKQQTKINENYLKECDFLWKKMVEELEDNNIKQFSDSPYSVYLLLEKSMRENKFASAEKKAKSKQLIESFRPEVTVIMPCYNSEKYLAEAIESIINQSFTNFRFLIIDDFSTDNTKKIAQKYEKTDKRIEVHTNNFAKGIPGAMNTGLELTNTKYVTRMDSDDISLIHRLAVQYTFLEENLKYGACAVNISGNIDGDIVDYIALNTHNSPTEWKFLFMNAVASAPMMYRTEIINKNRLRFDESLKTAEDYDFISRFLLHARIKQLPQQMYVYRIHKESVYQKNQKETIIRSKDIYDRFINNVLKGYNMRYETKYLSDFYKFNAEEIVDVDYVKCIEDLLKVLEIVSKYWKFDDEEVELSKEYISLEISKNVLWVENERQKQNQLKEPGSRIERLKRSLKNEGLINTTKKIINKIKRL